MEVDSFFKLDRKIFDSDIWTQPVELRLFVYLIGQARFKHEPNTKYKNKGVVIKRGQYLRSYRKLQDDLEYIENNALKTYSLSRIKTAIERLKNQDRIKTKNTQLGTLFTICNYAEYQRNYKEKNKGQNAEKTVSERSENGVRTESERSENGARTESERSENNTKNGVRREKNVKNDKNVNKTSDEVDELARVKKDNGRYEYPDDFEQIWEVYPRKINKKKAWIKWKNRIKDNVQNETLLKAAKNYAKECEMQDTEKRYIKYPQTFLGSGGYWEEYENKKVKKNEIADF